MGCAASRQVRVSVSADSGGCGDTIIANLTTALVSKRKALQMLEDAKAGGRAHITEAAWADELRSTICDLEKVVAQQHSALENGGVRNDSRQALVFSQRLAKTASADLQRWIHEQKPPLPACTTPPSAARRKDLVIATPPGLSLPGWDEGGDRANDTTELERLLNAAQADLRAHLKQAGFRAAELQVLKERAATLRAANSGTQ